jgi:anaerobic selenocysteine-containing dehydrogenase
MNIEVSRRDFIKKSAVAAVSLSALTAGTRSVVHAAGTSELLKVDWSVAAVGGWAR